MHVYLLTDPSLFDPFLPNIFMAGHSHHAGLFSNIPPHIGLSWLFLPEKHHHSLFHCSLLFSQYLLLSSWFFPLIYLLIYLQYLSTGMQKGDRVFFSAIFQYCNSAWHLVDVKRYSVGEYTFTHVTPVLSIRTGADIRTPHWVTWYNRMS